MEQGCHLQEIKQLLWAIVRKIHNRIDGKSIISSKQTKNLKN